VVVAVAPIAGCRAAQRAHRRAGTTNLIETKFSPGATTASKLASLLDRTAQDPRIRAAAASTIVAGSALAAAKVARDRVEKRRQGNPDAYRFEAGETAGAAIGRIARGQLQLTLGLLGDAHREDDGGKAVHDARKALKRLRALLRVSRPLLDDQLYHRENVTLRDAGRALSGTRDAQVLLDALGGLTARYAEGLHEGIWSRLRTSLQAAVEQSRTVDLEEATSLVDVLSDVRDRTETWPLSGDGGPELLAGGFARVYRRGRRALSAARSDPGAETLHELRKRAKDLWHAAELLDRISAKQMRELRRGAHHVSDLLGEDHDLTILREHAQHHAELVTTVELELLLALIGCRQEALRREALAYARELYRPKPKQLLRGLALA
jgi:CHAD domain-containing protein